MPKPHLIALVALAGLACSRTHAVTRPAPAPVAAPVVSGTPTVAATAPSTAAPRPDSAGGQDSAAVSTAEVTERAVAVFGDSVAADSAEDGPTWDIDVRSYETHARVAHYVQLFSGPAREHVLQEMERGTRYDAMIRSKLRAGGLPEDMTYLALVESGYSPHAYSRAAAVGMWQLMTSTAREVGLRVDWWVDERRDPVRSTDAAIRFLRDLKEQFGSLYLAAAAYNGGPGRVSRGLTRFADDLSGTSGEDVFFALAEKDYLRQETKDYVPQLIAAALISKDPAHYGFTVRQLAPYAYDSVRVPAATPVAAIARAAGASLADEIELNSELLRGVTPPNAGRWVRVPVGRAAGFDSAFAALPASERDAFRRVSVEKARALSSIAGDAGLTSRQVAWYNPSLRTNRKGLLVAGQTVLVPSVAVVAAARDVPDPAIERYGSSSGKAKITIHVVKRGESLDRIAARYHTSVSTVKRLNHLRRNVIVPGQPLVVKGPLSRESRASRSSRASASRGETARSTARGKASRAKASGSRARAKAGATRSHATAKATPKRKPPAGKGGSTKSAAAKKRHR